MAYHRAARINLPREKLHAVIHVIVETQIAHRELPVRRTAQRLMSEGLDRHEAIHAIGSVLAGYLNEVMREFKSDPDQVNAEAKRDSIWAYFAELESLTADGWRRSA